MLIPTPVQPPPTPQKNVFTFAPTGAGKTLLFWIPLLFNDNGIQILVTPLNILGDKNAREIADLFDISAVNVTSETATNALFKVQKPDQAYF